MAKTYKMLPVTPEVYEKVSLIAKVNNRGLGDQVSVWADAELPKCAHTKTPISIQVYATDEKVKIVKKGYYCSTCERAYGYFDNLTEVSAHFVCESPIATTQKAVAQVTRKLRKAMGNK